MSPKTSESCGCASNATHWIKRCEAHEQARQVELRSAALGSLYRLIQYYDRFPDEDNLHHVIERIKQTGPDAAADPRIVGWINAHRSLVLAAAKRPVAVGG